MEKKNYKTKIDYFNLFGIQVGSHYHAFDYACQICSKAYKLYEDAPEKEKEISWEMAKIIAKTMNPPIPLERYMPDYLERKYKKD